MNKPENEMLIMVLEPKTGKNGNQFYTGFLGMNSVHASEYQGKLFVRLQKWPKKEGQEPYNKQQPVAEDDITF
jgi:hypothetical protein